MLFEPTDPFVPAVGLADAHAQTIVGALARSASGPRLRRERLDTPDGDFVDVDHLDGPAGAPHLLVLHGLEGSSASGYVVAMLRGAHARGWGASALNFRSCSGVPNRTARSYHSGETGDVLFVVARLRERVRGPLVAAGFSLGGNVLLRVLIESGDASPFAAAAAVSVPFDLQACARTLDGGARAMWIYRTWFLRTLKAKSLAKARAHPGLLDPARIRAVRGIEEFDERVTAPLHGFRGASDYYARCSSGPDLHRIRVPTLLLTAEDDPLVPASSLPPVDAASPHLHFLRTRRGGHVGFVAGSVARPRFWGDAQVLRFLEARPGIRRRTPGGLS